MRAIERSTSTSAGPRLEDRVRPPHPAPVQLLDAPVPPTSTAESFYGRVCKPLFDRISAILLLLLTLPVFLVVAAAVLLFLGRPVLYRQARVGRDGEVFSVFKFRSMHPDRRRVEVPVVVERRVSHKRSDDPRHTPLGTILRRWRLDELPQLANVLAGHMSIVGPRPELVEVVRRYEPWQHQRHAVKPGITGPWQVHRDPRCGPMHEHTELDLDYVGRVSFRTDLHILGRTVICLLARNGR